MTNKTPDAIDEAHTSLLDAIQRVAEAARDMLDNAVPTESGWLVTRDEVGELRLAVKGWSDASEAALAAMHGPATIRNAPAAIANSDVVDMSLTPLDVGFDLRIHKDMDVELPAVDKLRVRYMDGDAERTIEGTPKEVGDELDRCGYRVGSPCEGRR